jgi:hypothetical protein
VPPAPQAPGPTRAEPDPGRRRRSGWGRGLEPAGTPPTSVRSAEAPALGHPGETLGRNQMHVRGRGFLSNPGRASLDHLYQR